MKVYIKQALPQPFILRSKVALRYAQHLADGSFFKFAQLNPKTATVGYAPQIIERQIIKRGDFFENKLSNIRLTAAKLSGVLIPEDAIFSFWHLVGNPSERNGFQKSRIIRNGTVDFDIGGGMCQVSGLVYLAALKAGLSILERHNHSVDIYKECERIAPLGADATVVYGTKDLQFLNNSGGAIQLIIETSKEEEIILTLLSQTQIEQTILHFDRRDDGNKRIVTTFGERQGKRKQLTVSVYQSERK